MLLKIGDTQTNYKITLGDRTEYATLMSNARDIFTELSTQETETVNLYEIVEEWDGEEWDLISEDIIDTNHSDYL